MFEGPYSYTSVGMDVSADGNGYVIMGTMQVASDSVVTLLMTIDQGGHLNGDIAYFPQCRGKAIKTYQSGAFSGYIIAGDRIEIDPNASQAGNIEISSMQLMFINSASIVPGVNDDPPSYTVTDTQHPLDTDVKTDIKSNALTITDDNRIIALGTFQDDGQPQKPLVVALNDDFTLDWTDKYESLLLDYINGKSVYYSNGNIIWASSILKQQGSFDESYITIPYLKENQTFENYSKYGDDFVPAKAFFVNDISTANVPSFGYGVIGTYGETNGTGKDLFFARISPQGDINQSTIKFIDGAAGLVGGITTEDTGDAICSSSEGGFLLGGTIFTTTGIGRGARDIMLTRVDNFGEVVWKKIIGGSGDEIVSSMTETPDGGIFIVGTNNIGGYSTIFVMKTNSRGELKN
jgi:hypothetical protein